jgi:hypothetical protein
VNTRAGERFHEKFIKIKLDPAVAEADYPQNESDLTANPQHVIEKSTARFSRVFALQ